MNKNLLFLIVTALVLGGLLVIFKSQPTNTNTTKPETKTFVLVVKNKKLISGSDKLTVTEGDTVIIKITSDEDEELHLHGYDKSVDLVKDVQAELKINANITGSFAFELEKSKTDIGSLEVQPK